ncbi:MAG: hypothetical protein NT154_33325 [Verrucomicrobia bacterium]|nr:hypothetical protein [Verrucomicrobiota bacterium]
MRKRIEDEYTHLRTSRQRKYQLRMLRDKRCTECGEPAVQGSRCLKHLIKARERQRKKRGLKRRYHNTLSYRLQEAEKAAAAKQAAKARRPATRKPTARPRARKA